MTLTPSKTMRLFRRSSKSRRRAARRTSVLSPANSKQPIAVTICSEFNWSENMSARSSGTSLPGTNSQAVHLKREGQHYPPRPVLAEILRDEAPFPWTLDAFTAYSARNFCLENLQFLQEAERYRNAYNGLMMGSSSAKLGDRPRTLRRHMSAQKEQLREMWTAIILNYIAPSSPRELNLPGDIRTELVSLHKSVEAPSPDSLQPAVQKIFELIEESILFSFINEVGPPPPTAVPETLEIDLESDTTSQQKQEPSSFSFEPSVSFTPGTNPSKTVTSHPSQGTGRPGSNMSAKTSVSSGTSGGALPSGSASTAPTLTDDTGSVTSPNMSATQVESTTPTTTPPRTPPASELDPPSRESPKTRNNDTWKRMSMRFLRKKSVSNFRSVDDEKFKI